jgi:putative transposase
LIVLLVSTLGHGFKLSVFHPSCATSPCRPSRHLRATSPNVLDRQFNPAQPNQAWVADIIYIRTHSGWLYLAGALDLLVRKVVGWAMAPDMQASLVCRALQRALVQRQPAPRLIVPRVANSGCCSQNASAAHQALLKQHGLVGSMRQAQLLVQCVTLIAT